MDFSSLPVFEPGEFLSGSYTGLYDTQKSGVDRPVKMKVERPPDIQDDPFLRERWKLLMKKMMNAPQNSCLGSLRDSQRSRIPDTQIPAKYHVFSLSPLANPIYKEKHSTESDSVLNTLVFPSVLPSKRIEVFFLASALDSMITGAISEDSAERIKILMETLQLGFSELVRQVRVNCAERGFLLEFLNRMMLSVVGACVSDRVDLEKRESTLTERLRKLHEKFEKQKEELHRRKDMIQTLLERYEQLQQLYKDISREREYLRKMNQTQLKWISEGMENIVKGEKGVLRRRNTTRKRSFLRRGSGIVAPSGTVAPSGMMAHERSSSVISNDGSVNEGSSPQDKDSVVTSGRVIYDPSEVNNVKFEKSVDSPITSKNPHKSIMSRSRSKSFSLKKNAGGELKRRKSVVISEKPVLTRQRSVSGVGEMLRANTHDGGLERRSSIESRNVVQTARETAYSSGVRETKSVETREVGISTVPELDRRIYRRHVGVTTDKIRMIHSFVGDFGYADVEELGIQTDSCEINPVDVGCQTDDDIEMRKKALADFISKGNIKHERIDESAASVVTTGNTEEKNSDHISHSINRKDNTGHSHHILGVSTNKSTADESLSENKLTDKNTVQTLGSRRKLESPAQVASLPSLPDRGGERSQLEGKQKKGDTLQNRRDSDISQERSRRIMERLKEQRKKLEQKKPDGLSDSPGSSEKSGGESSDTASQSDEMKKGRFFRLRSERLLRVLKEALKSPESGKPTSKKWICKFLSGMYQSKIVADEVCDREKRPRSGVPDFLLEYLKEKYGTMNLIELYTGRILATCRLYWKKDPRMRLFLSFLSEDLDVEALSKFLSAWNALDRAANVGLELKDPDDTGVEPSYVSLQRCFFCVPLVFPNLPVAAFSAIKLQLRKMSTEIDARRDVITQRRQQRKGPNVVVGLEDSEVFSFKIQKIVFLEACVEFFQAIRTK